MTHPSARRAALEARAEKIALDILLQSQEGDYLNKLMAAAMVDFALTRERATIEKCTAIADAHKDRTTLVIFGNDALNPAQKSCLEGRFDMAGNIADEIRGLLEGEGAGEGKDGADGD